MDRAWCLMCTHVSPVSTLTACASLRCCWQVGMVFVRCGNNGISHSPLEYVAPKDVAAVTTALYQYLSTELL